MDQTSVVRITLTDQLAFISDVCYVTPNQNLWWDCRRIHACLARKHITGLTLTDWQKSLFRGLKNGLAVDTYFQRTNSDRNLTPSTINTKALVFFYIQTIRTCRTTDSRVALRKYLSETCTRAVSMLNEVVRVTTKFGDLHISRRQIYDWPSFLRVSWKLPLLSYNSLALTWNDMVASAILMSPWESPAPDDVVVFIALFNRHKKRPTAVMSYLLEELHDVMLAFVSDLFDKFVLTVYAPEHDVTVPPTAIKSIRNINSRQYVSIEHLSKWEIMEQARAAGISVRASIAMWSHRNEGGAHCCMGENWIMKKLWMYTRGQKDWFSNTMHTNLLMDQGTVNGKSMSFTVAYSWEKDCGTPFYLTVAGGAHDLTPHSPVAFFQTTKQGLRKRVYPPPTASHVHRLGRVLCFWHVYSLPSWFCCSLPALLRSVKTFTAATFAVATFKDTTFTATTFYQWRPWCSFHKCECHPPGSLPQHE